MVAPYYTVRLAVSECVFRFRLERSTADLAANWKLLGVVYYQECLAVGCKTNRWIGQESHI